MIRLKLVRKIDQDKMFAIWRVDAPWQPVTKKVGQLSNRLSLLLLN